MTQYAVRNLNGDMLGNEKIEDLLSRATIAFNALSDEDKTKHLAEQRNSWLAGETTEERWERVKKLGDRIPIDAEYNLARVEGLLSRLEYINSHGLLDHEVEDIHQKMKGFIASLRLSLDPRRIDVV